MFFFVLSSNLPSHFPLAFTTTSRNLLPSSRVFLNWMRQSLCTSLIYPEKNDERVDSKMIERSVHLWAHMALWYRDRIVPSTIKWVRPSSLDYWVWPTQSLCPHHPAEIFDNLASLYKLLLRLVLFIEFRERSCEKCLPNSTGVSTQMQELFSPHK